MPEWLSAIWGPETKQMLLEQLPTLLGALGILILGWIAAYFIKTLVLAGLKRTTLDDRIAEVLGIDTDRGHGHRVERTVSQVVYYILLLLVLVWFFNYLKVEAVTRPLVTVLNEFAGAIPNITKAVVIGFGGFLLATGVRKLVAYSLRKAGFERRMRQLAGETPLPKAAATERVATREGRIKKKRRAREAADSPITNTIADVTYWFILIVAAIPVLEALQVGALAGPLSTALAAVTTYLPNVGAAAFLLVAGYVLARAARAMISGVLARVGVDRLVARLGFGRVTGEHTLGEILGTTAMVFVLLHFAISAVGRLGIQEISAPLGLMLDQVYAYLPKLLVGGVLLAIGVLVARVASNVTARLLAAMGFNTLMVHIGLFRQISDEAQAQELASRQILDQRRAEPSDDSPTEAETEDADPMDETDQLLGVPSGASIRTPADVAGVVVGAVLVLLFLRQALGTMQMAGLAELLDSLLGYLPNALVAVVVLGAGLWAGGWVHTRLDQLTGSVQDGLFRATGSVAHVTIIVFAAMVGLQQLGVAPQLIAIAFGLVLGAVCLAMALAFGLGGRDVAGRFLQRKYDRLQRPDRQL